MSEISDLRQTLILDAIDALTRDLDRFPSASEVAERTRIPRTSVIYHVHQLERAGQVERLYGGRALRRLQPKPPSDDTPTPAGEPPP